MARLKARNFLIKLLEAASSLEKRFQFVTASLHFFEIARICRRGGRFPFLPVRFVRDGIEKRRRST